jgi:hypothetical protein
MVRGASHRNPEILGTEACGVKARPVQAYGWDVSPIATNISVNLNRRCTESALGQQCHSIVVRAAPAYPAIADELG